MTTPRKQPDACFVPSKSKAGARLHPPPPSGGVTLRPVAMPANVTIVPPVEPPQRRR